MSPGRAGQIGHAVEHPVANDRDVDALVAAEVPAVGREAVARVAHDETVEDERTAGVAEARAAAGARVVLVAVRLEDLVGELLADLGRVSPDDRLALGRRASRARLACRTSVPYPIVEEPVLVEPRLLELVEVVLRARAARVGRPGASSRMTTPVSFQFLRSVKSLYSGCVTAVPRNHVCSPW